MQFNKPGGAGNLCLPPDRFAGNFAGSPCRLLSTMFRLLTIAFFISLTIAPSPAQVPNTPARPPRPTPPTRDPNTPGYVTAKDLPDGTLPPVKTDGNFILGPTHN